MEIGLPCLRLLKHEKDSDMKTVTRTPSGGISSPHFHKRLHLGQSPWKKQKHVEFWLAFAWQHCRNVFFKSIRQLWRCYGNQRWAKAVENSFLVLKISSFKLSESLKSVAQGVLEIFEEMDLEGGGGGFWFLRIMISVEHYFAMCFFFGWG